MTVIIVMWYCRCSENLLVFESGAFFFEFLVANWQSSNVAVLEISFAEQILEIWLIGGTCFL